MKKHSLYLAQIEIGKEVISVDPKYFRPTDLLLGDPTKETRME